MSLCDGSSFTGLESDIRTVSKKWFKHDAHDSVEQVICIALLAYFNPISYDRYANSTYYEIATLFRLSVLK